jgi:hypothetical protein
MAAAPDVHSESERRVTFKNSDGLTLVGTFRDAGGKVCLPCANKPL